MRLRHPGILVPVHTNPKLTAGEEWPLTIPLVCPLPEKFSTQGMRLIASSLDCIRALSVMLSGYGGVQVDPQGLALLAAMIRGGISLAAFGRFPPTTQITILKEIEALRKKRRGSKGKKRARKGG